MTKTELIKKWTAQIELWKRTVNDPLMYTKEQSIRAGAYCINIAAMLSDVEQLTSLD